MWSFGKHPPFSLHSDLRVFKHACATPLSTIQLCCALSQQVTTKQEYQKLFMQMQAASDRLSVLLLQLVNHNQEREKCNVTHLINEILPLFNHSTVNVQFFSTCQRSVYFHCNKLQLQEMLVCLINNAIESYEPKQQKHVHIGLKQTDGWLYVLVSDFGKGWRRKVTFLPTSRKSQRGVGLPYVLQTLAQDLHGSLEINTQPDLGTRVLVKLPLIQSRRSRNS